MKVDSSRLKARINAAIRHSGIRGRVKDVILEADQDNDGADFLRVTLEVRSLDDVSDTDLEALIESIERTIGDVDERYPSVRFADAA